jgi:hypothetical protein
LFQVYIVKTLNIDDDDDDDDGDYGGGGDYDDDDDENLPSGNGLFEGLG